MDELDPSSRNGGLFAFVRFSFSWISFSIWIHWLQRRCRGNREIDFLLSDILATHEAVHRGGAATFASAKVKSVIDRIGIFWLVLGSRIDVSGFIIYFMQLCKSYGVKTFSSLYRLHSLIKQGVMGFVIDSLSVHSGQNYTLIIFFFFFVMIFTLCIRLVFYL